MAMGDEPIFEAKNGQVEADPKTGIGVPWKDDCSRCGTLKSLPVVTPNWQVDTGLHFFFDHQIALVNPKPRLDIPPLGP